MFSFLHFYCNENLFKRSTLIGFEGFYTFILRLCKSVVMEKIKTILNMYVDTTYTYMLYKLKLNQKLYYVCLDIKKEFNQKVFVKLERKYVVYQPKTKTEFDSRMITKIFTQFE